MAALKGFVRVDAPVGTNGSVKGDGGSDLYAVIEWDPDAFGVGTKVIDDQHMHLLSIINRICRLRQEAFAQQAVTQSAAAASGSPADDMVGFIAPTGGNDQSMSHSRRRKQPPMDRFFDPSLQKGSEIGNQINNLVSYCAKQLANEEHLLETYGYVDRVSHVQEHETFVAEVSRVWRLMEEHNLELSDVHGLIAFLKNWLHVHIPKDRRFRELLIEKGFGAN